MSCSLMGFHSAFFADSSLWSGPQDRLWGRQAKERKKERKGGGKRTAAESMPLLAPLKHTQWETGWPLRTEDCKQTLGRTNALTPKGPSTHTYARCAKLSHVKDGIDLGNESAPDYESF